MSSLNANRWLTNPENIDLFNYLIKRTENVESPINIIQLARELKERNRTSQTLTCLKSRIERLRIRIQGFEDIDTNTKVKMLFSLSVPVNGDFLEKLKKNALVDVDEKNRITHYKAIDGSLELRGYHSQSAKTRAAKRDSKLNYRKLISDYFEAKDDAEAVPKNMKEEEMWNLIEFITWKCDTVDSPLNIRQLTKDFTNHFGISRSEETIRTRVTAYCNEIQGLESLKTSTKIKQLFCLSATLDSDFLQELRKNAVVEVDYRNRITQYTANNGRFSLHGVHSQSAKSKLTWKDESDESEESGSELHSENEDSIDDQIKLEPFRGSIQEDFDEFKKDEDIQQIPKPHQAQDEHYQIEEVPIKSEHEDQIEEDTIKKEQEEPVEVKPDISYNSKIKLFEAMHSLILCLDTPFLSWIQSKMLKKMSEIEGSHEMILNNEIVLIIQLLITCVVSNSVVNLSENVESVNLSNLLCYLKAAILNSKMSGVEGLVKNISKLIEEAQNKRIPMEKVANVLRSTSIVSKSLLYFLLQFLTDLFFCFINNCVVYFCLF
ncbi:unnamed protein product [Caenorhabditis brenneri]